MLDGVLTSDQLFETCKKRGWPALAVTEHGNMASVPDNYFAAQKHNIKYIPGVEIYYNDYELERQRMTNADESIRDLKTSENPVDVEKYNSLARNRHLTLLAQNMTGFTNLVKLTTQAYDTGFYYKPRIWFDKLAEYSEGIIVLSGCLNGPISHILRNPSVTDPQYNCKLNTITRKQMNDAVTYIKKFKELLGSNFYIEVQMPCLPDRAEDKIQEVRVFITLVKLANYCGVPIVLTNDAHYLDRRDFMIQKIMMAVDQDTYVDDPELFHVNSDEQYFKTRAELYNTFKTHGYCAGLKDEDFENMCDNTLRIAEKCEDFQPDKSPKVPREENANDILRELVYTALKEKCLFDNNTKYTIDNKLVTYKEQADIELDRFIEKDFASYFLITRNFINYSLSKGAPVGPRGSVGGSLVCYLLGITAIDPLKWGTSFSRFLSPSRGGYMLNIKAE
jgi:DNA polymerase-3 subunit alpha